MTAATDFAAYRTQLLPAPWLRSPHGIAWATATGVVHQRVQDLAVDAVKAGMLRHAPADGLHLKGIERDLERYPGQDEATYRAVLDGSWEAHDDAGSDRAIVDQFERNGWWARIKRNTSWDWDGHPGKVAIYWARMWVIVDPPHDFGAAPICGALTSIAGQVLCGMSSLSGRPIAALRADVERMRRIVRKWKGSHARVVDIIIRIGDSNYRLCGDNAAAALHNAAPECGAIGLVCGQQAARIGS